MSLRIGDGAQAREAILAALRDQARARDRVQDEASGVGGPPQAEAGASSGTSFGQQLTEGLRDVQNELAKAEDLPKDLVAGNIDDFHEIAVQIKRADLSFKFALEVRNKLMDAYREVMRMPV